MADMIKFYKGALANLPASGTNGALYITTDEGAIYLGTGVGMKRLGDFVQVDAVANLPASANTSALYYCVAENVLAKWTGTEWKQVNKQPTKDELKVMLGLDTEGAVTAAIATAKKAGDDAQASVDTLTEYVGTFTHDTAKTVVEYINAKTDGIATSGNLEALGQRVTIVEGKVATIEGDYLKGSDKTELEGKITTAQTAADNAQEYAEGVASDLADHEEDAVAHITAAEREAWNGKTTMDEVEAKGYLVADDIAGKANTDDVYTKDDVDGIVENINNAIDLKATADDVYTKTEINNKVGALEDEDERLAGLIGDNAQAILDEASARNTAIEDLNGKVDAKADQTALDAEIERATGIEGGLRTDVDAIKGDYLKAADKEELQGNINTLTGVVETLRDGIDAEKVDGVKDLITYVEEHGTEVTGMKEDIAANAKDIADEADRADKAEKALGVRIDDLSAVVADKAAQADLEALDGRVEVVEGKVSTLEGEMDAVEGRATTLEGKVADLETASATHALNSDLDAAIERIADNETAIGELQTASATHATIDALNTHANDAVKHITAEERTAWNSAEQNAKDDAAANLATARTEITTEIATAKGEAIADAEGKIATAIEGAKTDASNKDAVVLAEAQKGIADAKADLQVKIDTVSGALDTYKTENNAVVALKANAADVYNKAEVEAMLTWGEF